MSGVDDLRADLEAALHPFTSHRVGTGDKTQARKATDDVLRVLGDPARHLAILEVMNLDVAGVRHWWFGTDILSGEAPVLVVRPRGDKS